MALAVQSVATDGGRGVLCIPEARWLRWDGRLLEVGDGGGPASTVVLRAPRLMLVGRAFGALRPRAADGRRLAVAARFPHGATVLVERRGEETAVAASLPPNPRDVAQD
jgi:hypothetical protein